jgi:chromosome partitioning protein
VRSISILNFKGGVGKTSVCINLADALSRKGNKVLLIDGDRQRNTTTILADYERDTDYRASLREVLMEQCSIQDAIREARPNFHIVPSHRSLEQAGKHISANSIRTLKLLRTAVNSLQRYDFVLFDHSPSYGSITDALLLASSEMLIPVELEPFAFEGLLDMINKIGSVLAELEHTVILTGYIPNNLDYTKSMTQRYLSDLRETFAERVTSPIRTDAAISKSQEQHKTIFEYNPKSKGVEDFEALASYVLESEEIKL